MDTAVRPFWSRCKLERPLETPSAKHVRLSARPSRSPGSFRHLLAVDELTIAQLAVHPRSLAGFRFRSVLLSRFDSVVSMQAKGERKERERERERERESRDR